jgi:hypothetical protein
MFSSCPARSIENRCQNFRHDTETVKLCQEIVCPVNSIEYETKYI